MTNHETAEPELTETQKAYNVAQYEIFQLAAYGHCTYTNGELLTDEGKRQQADYNDRIRAAREELEAALLRLVAEHAETFGGDWGVPAAWMRSLADDPAELSLLAVRPDEREDDRPAAVSVPPPATRADTLRWAAEAQQPDDGEGDELVCVDECGCCDACGFEPFDTPAEGWREAARFLRRTARDSGDRRGVLHGARLIEAELRRLADESGPCVAGEQQNETPEAVRCGCEWMPKRAAKGA